MHLREKKKKGVLGCLNLGRVLNFDVTVVELPDCTALHTYLTGLSAVQTV